MLVADILLDRNLVEGERGTLTARIINIKQVMRVGVITFHFVNNFGGALQAYALLRVLNQMDGVQAQIINYKAPFIRFTDTVRIFPVTSNLRVFKSGLSTFKQRLQRKEKFERFAREYFDLTPVYSSVNKLRQNPPGFDKYICGSDQIWNPSLTAGVSGAYFLDFIGGADCKIAYAPSLGNKKMPEIFNRRAAGYINGIGKLSVRENAGREAIKSLTGKDAEILIDPTFLPDAADYNKISKNPLEQTQPYILLYIMQSDMSAYAYAKKLKEKTGMHIIEISRYGYKPDFVDETIIGMGPLEFLGLFSGASYVCTNSYHGLIFSLIFEKRLCLVPCRRYAERMNDLLAKLKIKLPDAADDTLFVSYDPVYLKDVLERERQNALKYLNESIFN